MLPTLAPPMPVPMKVFTRALGPVGGGGGNIGEGDGGRPARTAAAAQQRRRPAASATRPTTTGPARPPVHHTPRCEPTPRSDTVGHGAQCRSRRTPGASSSAVRGSTAAGRRRPSSARRQSAASGARRSPAASRCPPPCWGRTQGGDAVGVGHGRHRRGPDGEGEVGAGRRTLDGDGGGVGHPEVAERGHVPDAPALDLEIRPGTGPGRRGAAGRSCRPPRLPSHTVRSRWPSVRTVTASVAGVLATRGDCHSTWVSASATRPWAEPTCQVLFHRDNSTATTA